MTEFEKKLAEELAKQSVEKLAAPAVMPLQAIGEAIAGHVKSWRWVHQGRLKNRRSDAEIDNLIQETVQTIDVKAEAIPEERRQLPPLHIYGPTIEALSYTIESDVLRDMFVNMLIKSMDSDSGNPPLPSYVEILKQLSPDEAKIIEKLSQAIQYSQHYSGNPSTFSKYVMYGGLPVWPLARMIQYIDERKYQRVVVEGVFNLSVELERKENIPTYVSNLERLGIISTHYDTHIEFRGLGVKEGILVDISNDDPYKSLEEDIRQNHMGFIVSSSDDYRLQKGYMQLTKLGVDFIFSAVFPSDGIDHIEAFDLNKE